MVFDRLYSAIGHYEADPYVQQALLYIDRRIALDESPRAYLLYSQVQVPIKRLVYVFRRSQAGDYAVRMKVSGRNEFSFLATRFNSMVEQIQELFEHVYMEKIHVREAKLKRSPRSIPISSTIASRLSPVWRSFGNTKPSWRCRTACPGISAIPRVRNGNWFPAR